MVANLGWRWQICKIWTNFLSLFYLNPYSNIIIEFNSIYQVSSLSDYHHFIRFISVIRVTVQVVFGTQKIYPYNCLRLSNPPIFKNLKYLASGIFQGILPSTFYVLCAACYHGLLSSFLFYPFWELWKVKRHDEFILC